MVSPILLFVFFFIAIFFLLVGGFILSQKDFNVAFISIGVDYFQVLSILRSARVEWPAFLKVRTVVVLVVVVVWWWACCLDFFPCVLTLFFVLF